MNIPSQSCYGCGQPLEPLKGEYCPHCGYFYSERRETIFLRELSAYLRFLQLNGGDGLTLERIDRLGRAHLLNIHPQLLRDLHPLLTPERSHLDLPALLAAIRQRQDLLLRSQQPQLSAPPAPGVSALTPGRSESFAPRAGEVTNGWPLAAASAASRSFVPVTPMPQPMQAAAPTAPRVNAWKAFLNSRIMLVVSLMAFLVLIFTLMLNITVQREPWLAGLVTAGAQVFFGLAAVRIKRSFPQVARIYSLVFLLLIPLYIVPGRITTGNMSGLVAFAALYSAFAYGAFAIYQGFSPFAYLGLTSLLIALPATSYAFFGNASVRWWPALLVLLALALLISLPRSTARPARLERWFSGPGVVLRTPMRIYMLLIVIGCTGVLALLFGLVFLLAPIATIVHATFLPDSITRVSLFVAVLLLSIWQLAYLGLSRPARPHYLAGPLLFALCVLVGIFMLPPALWGPAYACALTCLGLLFYAANRWPQMQPRRFFKQGLHLDVLALLALPCVPLLNAPGVPYVLLSGSQASAANVMQVDWLAGLLILLAALLSAAIAAEHSFQSRSSTLPRKTNAWPWLFLLSGALLNWAYGAVMFPLTLAQSGGNSAFVWGLVLLALGLTCLAVVVRQRAYLLLVAPLDVLAFCEALLVGYLASRQQGIAGALALAGFAAFFYLILLFQRRFSVLCLPFFLALLALPGLHAQSGALYLAALSLPLAALIIRRANLPTLDAMWRERFPASWKRVPLTWVKGPYQRALPGWEWPLLVFGLLCGLIALTFNPWQLITLGQTWNIHLPFAATPLLLALVWYLWAALARTTWWLPGSLVFAFISVLSPGNSFWALAALAPLLMLSGLLSGKLADQGWAMPFYITGAFTSLVVGLESGLLSGSYALAGMEVSASTLVALILLGYAGLSYLVSLLNRRAFTGWVGLFFALWSLWAGRDSILLTLITGVVAALGAILTTKRPLLRGQWYSIALAAALLAGLSASSFSGPVLLVFTILASVVMMRERRPEVLFLAFGLACWTIVRWLAPAGLLWQFLAGDLLCLLTLASQFVWRTLPPVGLMARNPVLLARLLGLGGQMLLVLLAVNWGGPSAPAPLNQMGVVALLVLAVMLAWVGVLQYRPEMRRLCFYGAGLLITLLIPWESAIIFRPPPSLDLLLLAPSGYLTIIAPWLMREQRRPALRYTGRTAAIVGALGLLVPACTLSLLDSPEQQWFSILLLLAVSLGLFFLGLTSHTNLFTYTGAALVVIGSIRGLFYVVNSQENGFHSLLIWAAMIIAIALLVITSLLFMRPAKKLAANPPPDYR